MKQTTIVGIDYSLTSPCVCVNDGEKIMFYYLTKKKKHLGKIADNIIGEEHLEYRKAWMDPDKMNLIMSEYEQKIAPVVNTSDDIDEVVDADLIDENLIEE